FFSINQSSPYLCLCAIMTVLGPLIRILQPQIVPNWDLEKANYFEIQESFGNSYGVLALSWSKWSCKLGLDGDCPGESKSRTLAVAACSFIFDHAASSSHSAIALSVSLLNQHG